MIKDSEETVYVMDPAKMKDQTPPVPDPVFTKEDEIITIIGYSCQKYKSVTNTEQGEVISYLWVTDKFILPQAKNKVSGGMGAGMISSAGINGTPLKTMINQGGMTIVLTASKITTTAPDKKLFKLPKNYKKEDFDVNKMMGGMGM